MASSDAAEPTATQLHNSKELLKPPEEFSMDFEQAITICDNQDVNEEVLDWDDSDAEAAKRLQEELAKSGKNTNTVAVVPQASEMDSLSRGGGIVAKATPGPTTEAKVPCKELVKALQYAREENEALRKETDTLHKELGSVRLELTVAARVESRLESDLAKARESLSRAEREIGVLKAKKEAMVCDCDRRIDIMADKHEELLRNIVRQTDELTECRREMEGGGPRCKRSRVEGDGDTVMADETSSEQGIAQSIHAPANAGATDDVEVPYSEQRQADIDAARARLPQLHNFRRMPTYDGPTLEAMGFVAPPSPPADNAVDEHGYPLNEATFRCMFTTALTHHVWVYMFHIFCLWVYRRSLPEDQQMLMHKLAIQLFVMPDWFAEMLFALAAYRVRQQIRELKRGFATTSRSNISMLDGELFAGWIQFNESRIPGCEFIDNAWSVDYCKARGANLFDLMCIHRDVNNKVVRVIIEKVVIKIMAAPGMYEQAAISNGWELTIGRNIRHFTTDGAGTLTVLSVMQVLYTEMGVDIELIDDAHSFAHAFLRRIIDNRVPVPGWTIESTVDLLLGAEQYGHQVPPGITTDDDKEVLIRHPIHPWRLSGESALQDGMFSHWTHPLLQGMRREPNSKIQTIINLGPHPLPQFSSLMTPSTPKSSAPLHSSTRTSGPSFSVGANTAIIPSQFPDLAPDALASYNIGSLAGPSTISEHNPTLTSVASNVVVRLPTIESAGEQNKSLEYGDPDVPMGA
ncbi:hypothetical protein C8R44DRAFT_732104 [Mycena epipterygia]|nr:hypothetical protein C8R44DRAFT_732104 [Mycena epipterygia]